MTKYNSFNEFYPYYLREHANVTCRRLHFIGSALIIVLVLLGLWQQNGWYFLVVPVCGYGFAWVGHFFFEHNKPATFKYPLYSLMGDWKMFAQILNGKVTIFS